MNGFSRLDTKSFLKEQISASPDSLRLEQAFVGVGPLRRLSPFKLPTPNEDWLNLSLAGTGTRPVLHEP